MTLTARKITPYAAAIKGRELSMSEAGQVSGGYVTCNHHQQHKTGKVIKHWITSVLYYKEIEYYCPDCGRYSWRTHYF